MSKTTTNIVIILCKQMAFGILLPQVLLIFLTYLNKWRSFKILLFIIIYKYYGNNWLLYNNNSLVIFMLVKI